MSEPARVQTDRIPAGDTMRAVVYHGPRDVRIERRPVPVPVPGRDEVLLRVLRSRMCGTDASEWRDGPHLYPSSTPNR